MSIRRNNQLMMDAFEGIYLIEADVDEWGFPPKGWDFDSIPVFFALDANGNPTGGKIDGDAWLGTMPEHMAPPLKAFFDSIRN